MTTFAPSTRTLPGKEKAEWQCRFVAIPQALLTHPTYNALPGGASKLLLAMLSGYVGNNNGHLTATHSRMKAFGFNSKDSLARGIRELIAFGYIVRTRTQHLRSPALYAVTWLPINNPPAGKPYDSHIKPGNEALDLWRQVDPISLRAA